MMKLRSSSLGGNYTDSNKTDAFVKKIENNIKIGECEGLSPPKNDIVFLPYGEKGYTINCDGVIKTPKGKPMTYLFRKKGKSDKKGKPYIVTRYVYKEKEGGKTKIKHRQKSVILLMKRYFGRYIEGYRKSLENPDAFMLVPKNGDWKNLAWNNLIYVDKKDYENIATKDLEIEYYLRYIDREISDQDLAKKISTSHSWVNRVRKRLTTQGKISSFLPKEIKDLNMRISREMIPIYIALYTSKGLKSNKDLIIEVFDIEWEKLTVKEKKNMTGKIVRARKKLLKHNVIEKYNTYGVEISTESVREQLVAELENKTKIGKTHQEIADTLGLKKNQVDNFVKKLKNVKKKEKNRENREESEKKS